MARIRRQGIGFVLGMLVSCLAAPAFAQLSGTAGIVSDYRLRGVSLSDRQPAVTASLAYDHPSGFYAGGSVIGTDYGGPKVLGYIEYAGFATARTTGPAFDFGVSNQDLAYFWKDRRTPARYTEAYFGVIGSKLSAHIYYSPNYLRSGWGTIYTDISGSLKPAEDWRLFAHLGASTPVGSGSDVRRERYDLRAGVARQFRNLEIQAALVATSPDPPVQTPQGRTAVTLGANYFF